MDVNFIPLSSLEDIIMIKKFYILLLVVFGFCMMPSTAFACGTKTKTEKTCCKKESSSAEKSDCCNKEKTQKTKIMTVVVELVRVFLAVVPQFIWV